MSFIVGMYQAFSIEVNDNEDKDESCCITSTEQTV
jgi:hypothetical protein